MDIKQLFSTWKEVFSNWRYVKIMIFVSLIFYTFNVLVSNWKNIFGIYSSFGFFETVKFLFIFWIGFKSTILSHSFVSLIVISILFGVLVSLISYKLSFNSLVNKKAGFFGISGMFL